MSSNPDARVMVVDDNNLVRRLVTKILRRAGMEPVVAEDGLEALEKIRGLEGELDLLITDVVMPNMNGAELAKVVGAEFPQIKIIIISGFAEEHLIKNNLSIDGYRFLAKPFTEEDLLGEVEAALP